MCSHVEVRWHANHDRLARVANKKRQSYGPSHHENAGYALSRRAFIPRTRVRRLGPSGKLQAGWGVVASCVSESLWCFEQDDGLLEMGNASAASMHADVLHRNFFKC